MFYASVIPAGLLRRSKALGYEGWKAGIHPERVVPRYHFPWPAAGRHGNDRHKYMTGIFRERPMAKYSIGIVIQSGR